MTELGFLPFNLPADCEERDLVMDIWAMTKGEEKGGISIENLRTILVVVSGITGERTGTAKRDVEAQGQSDASAFTDDGVFRISAQASTKMFVKFKKLYVNRL